jgi:hypothetical protein
VNIPTQAGNEVLVQPGENLYRITATDAAGNLLVETVEAFYASQKRRL